MKRMISLVLALVLILTMLPLRAKAATGGKLIAITFDDGPSSRYTEDLLDGLKERGVSATFFMLGEYAKYNPDIVKRAYEEGHEIACHTWSHPDLTGCSESKIRKEIEDTFEQLDNACGDEADYLVRPPYGSTNQSVRNVIDAPLVCWSVDSEDWKLLNTQKVREKIVADTYDGCIILCHDIHSTTIPAALGAIDDLIDLGYEFVTVSELYRRRGRTLEDHKLHYQSKRNGIDYGPIPAPVITCTGDAKGVNTVTINCPDKNVPLYYTTDGSYPNQDAKRYTGPFSVPYGTKIKAVAAYKLNGSRSALISATADRITVAAPVITQDADGALVMTTPTVNAQIYFTADGSAPNANALPYMGPEFIVGGCLIRAVTVHEKGVSGETRAYLSQEGSLYWDIFEGQWFYEAMNWAHQEGILNGISAYEMAPEGQLTRAMAVTLLYRFSRESLEEDWAATNSFMDLEKNAYYNEAVEWAYRNGIVNGYSDLAFGPNDMVSRQQMCKMVASFLSHCGTPLPEGESCEGVFADYDRIADWALPGVEAMVSAGLLKGIDGNMEPEQGSNRAQFCVILERMLAYMESYVPEEPEATVPAEPVDPTVPTEPPETTVPGETMP